MSLIPDEEWKRARQQITKPLQNVKMKLMSREFEQQKEAVDWLNNELNINSKEMQNILIQTLLKSEIITSLCEMIMTMEESLVISTLDCLASLTISEEFYRQNHASYVIVSILRIGHFLTLESNLTKDHLPILASIAYTLEKIFKGSDDFGISANTICELDQIFEFFKKLLNAEYQAYRVIFSAAAIINIVLRYVRGDEGIVNGELVFSVIQTTLKLMRRILEAKNPDDAKYALRAMVMTCGVCTAGIPLCIQSNDHDVNKIGLPRVDLANCIYSSMMKTVIPNFKMTEKDEKNGQFYLWFVTCINGLYELNYLNLKDLSNYLTEQGFLKILPNLSTLQKKNLRNETLLLLSRVLTTLAEVSLSTEMWIGGTKQFQKFLINAFKSLPIEPSAWLPYLSEGDTRADALLVLFYFNLLADPKCNASLYLPAIIVYVLSFASLKTKRKSIIIQKAIWFTFSIAAVSYGDVTALDSYDVAITSLFNELESVDINQCYTHHPAILVHCLKSTFVVSDKLRASVVYLWLKNGGDVKCIVDATIEGDLKNYYCLLHMVKTGSPDTVDVAMKAIHELVKNSEVIENLGNIVWDMLQQILVSDYKRDDYNISSILKLATIFEPNQISGSLLVQLLYRLTSFIVENEDDKTLVSLGIENAYCLLMLSIRRNDVRGIAMFTNQQNLIKVLKTLAFGKDNLELSYMCFNCLSTLIMYQGNYSIECENTLEIESEELIQQLYLEEYLGALKLTAAIFTTEIEKPLISLKGLFHGSNRDVVIRAIYIQLHVIHSKSGPEVRNLCYSSFVGLLRHCKMVNNSIILKSLCEMGWTYLLIEITIAGNQSLDSDFVEFVSNWLLYRFSISQMRAPSLNRAFGRDEFEMTLDLLGKAAITKFKENPAEESLQELVQSLMLFQKHFSDNIGTELEQISKQLTKN